MWLRRVGDYEIACEGGLTHVLCNAFLRIMLNFSELVQLEE